MRGEVPVSLLLLKASSEALSIVVLTLGPNEPKGEPG